MCPPFAATCNTLSLFLLNLNKSFGTRSITRFTISLLPYQAARVHLAMVQRKIIFSPDEEAYYNFDC